MFVNTGQVVGTMGPGRHQIDADEVPGLGAVIDWATGGNAYRAELYFVGTREFPGNTFGGRIDDVQDPQTGMIVTLRVFGDYSMQVKDPVALITNLVGTVDVANNEAITGWMSDQLLKVMRTHMTVQIVRNGWPILGLSAYTPDIEEEVMAKGNEQLESYGVAIIRMGNFDINLSEQDETQLKTLAKDTAYSRLAGSFQQYAAGEMALGAGPGDGPGRCRRRRGLPRGRVGSGRPGRGAGGAPDRRLRRAGFRRRRSRFRRPAGRRGRVPELPRRQRRGRQVLRFVWHVAGTSGGGVRQLPGGESGRGQVLRLMRDPDGRRPPHTARRAGRRWRPAPSSARPAAPRSAPPRQAEPLRPRHPPFPRFTRSVIALLADVLVGPAAARASTAAGVAAVVGWRAVEAVWRWWILLLRGGGGGAAAGTVLIVSVILALFVLRLSWPRWRAAAPAQ